MSPYRDILRKRCPFYRFDRSVYWSERINDWRTPHYQINEACNKDRWNPRRCVWLISVSECGQQLMVSVLGFESSVSKSHEIDAPVNLLIGIVCPVQFRLIADRSAEWKRQVLNGTLIDRARIGISDFGKGAPVMIRPKVWCYQVLKEKIVCIQLRKSRKTSS